MSTTLAGKRQVIGVKTESSQGSAATLSATDFIEIFNPSWEPKINMLKQNWDRATLDPLPDIVGVKYATITFEMPKRSSGAAGTAFAPYDAAMQASGASSTVSASTSVTYAPISAPPSSFDNPGKTCTIVYNKDGVKTQLVGCVGKRTETGKAGEIVMVKFTFTGAYGTPTAAAIPSTTYISTKPVALKNGQLTFATAAWTPHLLSYEFDDGNDVKALLDGNINTGFGEAKIVARLPKIKLECWAELPAVYSAPSILEAATGDSLSMILGSAAGNIITDTYGNVQLIAYKESVKNGIIVWDLEYQAELTSGDDYYSQVHT